MLPGYRGRAGPWPEAHGLDDPQAGDLVYIVFDGDLGDASSNNIRGIIDVEGDQRSFHRGERVVEGPYEVEEVNYDYDSNSTGRYVHIKSRIVRYIGRQALTHVVDWGYSARSRVWAMPVPQEEEDWFKRGRAQGLEEPDWAYGPPHVLQPQFCAEGPHVIQLLTVVRREVRDIFHKWLQDSPLRVQTESNA